MHEKWMKEAIKEALKAQSIGEVPVGAIIISDSGEILSKAHNLKESGSDPTGHAEVLAIKKAAQKINSWRLNGASLYVTLEPCMMCTGAIIQSRLEKIYFGASDPKGGCAHSLMRGFETKGLNHKVLYHSGVLEEECGNLLTNFFKNKRQEKLKKV